MDTEKLYDQDAFLREFDAVVTECYEGKDGSCLVTLDRTAFYPCLLYTSDAADE